MCPAYEVKVVSVEEFWNNICPKSEADSTVVFTPALEIESCVVVVVVAVVDNCACCCSCLYFLEFIINWYLQLEPLFQISLRLLLSAWAWFCNWKMSLSAWCPIQCKTVYILSEFYLGLWPRHVPVFFLSLIFFFIYCYSLSSQLFFFIFHSCLYLFFFVFTWTSLSGSDHKRSQRRPVSGTSVGRMIRLK